MSRFRTNTFFALGAAAFCLSGCVSAEKNEYRQHLGLTIAQSPAGSDEAMMLLDREPMPGSVAIVEFDQLP